MTNDDASPPAGESTEAATPLIQAVRAQIAAARLRREALIASGTLSGSLVERPASLPTKDFPGYTLLREIHRGGQGVVYQAMQQSTNRKVAIKVLLEGSHASKSARQRFEREIELVASLRHSNVISVFHSDQTADGLRFCVMDYVRGLPLTRYVRQNHLTLRDALALFATVCEAVNHAHQKGVIHRDLKPSNILVDVEGVPKVLDFGLAKMVGGTEQSLVSMTGQVVGTLPYMSPEQTRGNPDEIDTRTDVYALGVLLYEMLTGRYPYPMVGPMAEVLRHIAQSDPTPPSRAWTVESGILSNKQRSRIGRLSFGTHRASTSPIDDEMQTIVLKALAKEPDRRYQSAGELARDIRRYLAGEAIEATPPSASYRLRKFVRRNRGVVIASVSIAVALVLGIIGTTIGLVRAVREQHRTEQQRLIAQNEADRADREAGQARAVNEFMREVLTSVEPRNHGAEVRLLTVLGNASQAASKRFANDPLHEAQVRSLLGDVFHHLTKFLEAKAEHEKALALWRQHAGENDPRTLVSELRNIVMALNFNDADSAEKILKHCLPKCEELFGPNHINTLEARRAAATVCYLFGRLDEGEQAFSELRRHPVLANDDRVQAALLRGLISISERRAGMDSLSDRLAALSVIEPLARERLERVARYFGPDSGEVLETQAKLSEIICELGQCQEAADMCRAILDNSTERMGECHLARLKAMYVLAMAANCLGEEQEPAELHLRRIACQRIRLAVDSPIFLSSLSDSLKYMDRAGRGIEGEALARELTESLAKIGGGHDMMLYASQLYVARFVSMQGRFDEAEKLFQALAAQEKRMDSLHAARLHLYYGSHLTRQGQLDEAEEHLLTTVSLVGDARNGTWQSHPDDVLIELIALYDAWGKTEMAEEYRRLREEIVAESQRRDPRRAGRTSETHPGDKDSLVKGAVSPSAVAPKGP